MTKCNNCGDDFDPKTEGLLTTEAGRIAAAVCGGCCKGVQVAKVVVRRTASGFNYDQFTALEMSRKAG